MYRYKSMKIVKDMYRRIWDHPLLSTGLYTVYNGAAVQGTVAVLELAGNQECRQPLQGFPLSTGLGRRTDEVRDRSL